MLIYFLISLAIFIYMFPPALYEHGDMRVKYLLTIGFIAIFWLPILVVVFLGAVYLMYVLRDDGGNDGAKYQ